MVKTLFSNYVNKLVAHCVNIYNKNVNRCNLKGPCIGLGNPLQMAAFSRG